MTERKPKGWGKFDEAMKKLVNVPKGQVDKKIADEQAARKVKKQPPDLTAGEFNRREC